MRNVVETAHIARTTIGILGWITRGTASCHSACLRRRVIRVEVAAPDLAPVLFDVPHRFLVVQRVSFVLRPRLVLDPVLDEERSGAGIGLFCTNAALWAGCPRQLLPVCVIESERGVVKVLGKFRGSRHEVLTLLGHSASVRVSDGVSSRQRHEVI